MLSKFRDRQPAFVDYVEHVLTKTNKLSHAYLIETNSFSQSKELVFAFVKTLLGMSFKTEEERKKIEHLIDEDAYEDFVMIEPDGAWIKKEQLLTLQANFKTKSINGGKRVYVIFSAEKLNQASANTLLKFLEEPADDIVAILVTVNRYKVLSTILSRCQVLSLAKDVSTTSHSEDDNIYAFIDAIYCYQAGTIAYLNHLWYPIYRDKDDYKAALQRMKEIYMTLLEQNNKAPLDNPSLQKIVEITTIDDIIRKLKVIEEAEQKLSFNVNLKMWLDQFVINLSKGGESHV